MFFGNREIRFFKINWLDYEHYEDSLQKRNAINIAQY